MVCETKQTVHSVIPPDLGIWVTRRVIRRGVVCSCSVPHLQSVWLSWLWERLTSAGELVVVVEVSDDRRDLIHT